MRNWGSSFAQRPSSAKVRRERRSSRRDTVRMADPDNIIIRRYHQINHQHLQVPVRDPFAQPIKMVHHDPKHVASIMLSWHSLDLVTCTTLQSLWAGYGQICAITARATTDAAAGHLSKLCGVEPGTAGSTYNLILKLISPPTESTRDLDEGHLRKMLSYEVEQYFYSNVVPLLDDDIGIAKCLTATQGADGRKGEEKLDGLMATIMVDLRPRFPVAGEKRSMLDHTQVRGVLDWLASFHSNSRSLLPKTLDSYVLPPLQECTRRNGAIQNGGNGLWLNGGYTYLATRRKEYASLIEDDSEWSEAMCKVPEHTSLSIAEMAAPVNKSCFPVAFECLPFIYNLLVLKKSLPVSV